jgi:ribosome-associated toxin RatA of RatAB toxin-antitoxin module
MELGRGARGNPRRRGVVTAVPAYEATRQIEVRATPEDCFRVLTDYEHMPQWQSRICHCRVLETDEQGRGTVVEYAIDAKLRVVRYRLRHSYDEPTAIGSEYLGGDFREFTGQYRFAEHDGRTAVSFSLKIDPGFKVPGPVVRMLGPTVMGKSLEDVKRQIEQVAHGTQ